MLGVGHKFPAYSLQATVSLEKGKAFQTIGDEYFSDKWKIYFFWPKDFTFVCTTKIPHPAGRTLHADLHDLPFPMLADVKRELCAALGILDPQEGVAQRATFIVDPHNVIRFVSVNDLSVGRNPLEVLRVLDALQTDELCPCNWQKGEEALKVSI